MRNGRTFWDYMAESDDGWMLWLAVVIVAFGLPLSCSVMFVGKPDDKKLEKRVEALEEDRAR